MRRLPTALTIAAIAVGIYATSAPGARHSVPRGDRQLAAVQRQVRVLQKQVHALQVRTSQVVWALEMIETAMTDGETCFAALTADELQNTWSQMDQLAVHLGAKPIFGTQATVDDRKACQDLSIPRLPVDPSVAPSVAPLAAFIRWSKG